MVKVAFFREELDIPDGVKVTISGNNIITVKGPKGGPITKDFSHARGIKINVENKKIKFETNFPKGNTLALVKTIINIINNLIIGVQTNYKYLCKVCFSHFPCQVEVREKTKELHVVNFLGEKAPRKAKYFDNVDIEIDGDDVILSGPDKEVLGQVAANLKRCCRIRKKDPRVFQDGVYLYKRMLGEETLWEIR